MHVPAATEKARHEKSGTLTTVTELSSMSMRAATPIGRSAPQRPLAPARDETRYRCRKAKLSHDGGRGPADHGANEAVHLNGAAADNKSDKEPTQLSSRKEVCDERTGAAKERTQLTPARP